MGKFKTYRYHFNKETLAYDKVEVTFLAKILQILSYIATCLVFGAVVVVISWNVLSSPKEKKYREQIEELSTQYEIFAKRLDNLNGILNDMQNRDDHIYRILFEADPIVNLVSEYSSSKLRYDILSKQNNDEIVIETNNKINSLEKNIKQQSKSFNDIISLAKKNTALIEAIPSILPVADKDVNKVASGFGFRIHPIYKTRMFHAGIDFIAPQGTPVFATANGIVETVEKISSKKGSGSGNCISINHGYDYKTFYANLSRIDVTIGKAVKRGDIIGYVGNTGTSTAPHLHYEVSKGNDKIDPINYFFNDLTPEQYQKIIEISSHANQAFD